MSTHDFPRGAGPVTVFQRYAKAFLAAVGSVLGMATPAGVATALAGFGVEIPVGLVAGICVAAAPVGALLATLFGPANREPHEPPPSV